MRTIAIINQKGGCGKTTVSINLAATLASMGRRTLLVDMDPQSHCCLGLAVPEPQVDRSIADLLRHGLNGSMAFTDIIWQITRNLDLAPSTVSLAGIEQELAATPDKDRRLGQVLSMVQDDYDFCIIDCPPSIGLLTFNAMRAANEVVIPVETGYFSMQGAMRQQETIQMLSRRVHHDVRFSVLATMYDVRTKLARQILAELRRHFENQLLPVVIHFNSKLKEAASFGQPITEYDYASRGMKDFENLASWLLANPPQAQSTASDTSTANPVMSRAAELVERARALSARTAALAAAVADGGQQNQPILTPPASASIGVEPQMNPPAPPPERLKNRLAHLHGVRATGQGVIFVQPASDAKQISIAGDFNNWNPDATPLKYDDRMGVWQACVPMPPGRYCYRIVVDGRWVQDPYNNYVESNPYGELNNVVEIEDQEPSQAVDRTPPLTTLVPQPVSISSTERATAGTP